VHIKQKYAMLAYQHISQHFGSPQRNESRLKRSMSPGEMTYRKESIDYVRQIRRRSLSRSTSPVRSHSPTYLSHMNSHSEHHLIKRSVSEEDLRMSVNHERRRLSMEQSEHHVISHRPQILMNYHRGLKEESVERKSFSEQQYEPSEEPEVEPEADDEAPLDLSMGSKKRRGRTDSGTESDDSTAMGDEGRGNEGRAYKKSLMKRYCKSK
jgi:hypothetical protein